MRFVGRLILSFNKSEYGYTEACEPIVKVIVAFCQKRYHVISSNGSFIALCKVYPQLINDIHTKMVEEGERINLVGDHSKFSFRV